MIITNRKGLPQALVAACSNDPYSAGTADISITRLLAPPRQVALMKQHADELTEDVADRIWALRSQGIHAVLERAAGVNEISEVRWERECLGWRVSGKLDLVSLADGTLTDWKDTSVWSIKDALDPKTTGKVEWEQQVNLLADFGRYNGYRDKIKNVQVVAFGRDWRKNERLRYGDEYPDAEVTVIPLPLWDHERARVFLEQRVSAHQQAQLDLAANGPVELTLCTPEERWAQPTTYAVCKVGNKTAIRLYLDRGVDSVLSAEALTKDYGDEPGPLSARQLADKHARSQPGLEVRVRPGKSPRCEQYCAALPHCDQGQRIVAALKEQA